MSLHQKYLNIFILYLFNTFLQSADICYLLTFFSAILFFPDALLQTLCILRTKFFLPRVMSLDNLLGNSFPQRFISRAPVMQNFWPSVRRLPEKKVAGPPRKRGTTTETKALRISKEEHQQFQNLPLSNHPSNRLKWGWKASLGKMYLN